VAARIKETELNMHKGFSNIELSQQNEKWPTNKQRRGIKINAHADYFKQQGRN
jgi:hypothetical protein